MLDLYLYYIYIYIYIYIIFEDYFSSNPSLCKYIYPKNHHN